MAYRRPIRFSAKIEISADMREMLRKQGVYDPSDKKQLSRLAQVAVDQVLGEWAELRYDVYGDED